MLETQVMVLIVGPLPFMWKTEFEFLDPCFSWVQAQRFCGHLESDPEDFLSNKFKKRGPSPKSKYLSYSLGSSFLVYWPYEEEVIVQVIGFLLRTWETWIEFQAPCFVLTLHGCCECLGYKPLSNSCQSVCISLCCCCCFKNSWLMISKSCMDRRAVNQP